MENKDETTEERVQNEEVIYMPTPRSEAQCGTWAGLQVVKSRGNRKVGKSDQEARDEVGKVNNDQI